MVGSSCWSCCRGNGLVGVNLILVGGLEFELEFEYTRVHALREIK